MQFIEHATIHVDNMGISHFRQRRTHSPCLVQHSKFILKGWRGNCGIKLLLYYSDPSCPDISEIKNVCRYVVSYTGKRHNTSQTEKDAIQNIIMGWVRMKVLNVTEQRSIIQILNNTPVCVLHKLTFALYRNLLCLLSTQDNNLTGLRTITKKALHMLTGHSLVSMQEAVHMVDN